MLIERTDDSKDPGNQFDIWYNDEPTNYRCVREHLPDGTRGLWILYQYQPGFGFLRLDRDRYSNDLLERVEIQIERGGIYDDEVRIEGVGVKAYFDVNRRAWENNLEILFGDDWVSDYEPHTKCAVMRRVKV